MNEDQLSPNALAFLALSNEYCHAIENARDTEREDFVDNMLRLLPRIYISATDIDTDSMHLEVAYLQSVLDEDYYDNVRLGIETLMGEHDTYLEVFEDDMKFSESPIAANISEELADIFQELYNMLETVKDSPNDFIKETLGVVKEDFASFWGQKLCNVLRALNAVKYNYDN